MVMIRNAIQRLKVLTSKLPLILLIFLFGGICLAYMLVSYYLQESRDGQAFQKLADVVATQESPLPDSIDALPAASGAPEARQSGSTTFKVNSPSSDSNAQ